MDIKIYCSHTNSLIRRRPLQELLQQLPASLQGKALRYKSELSAYNYVVGRLLLKYGLDDFGLDNDLEEVEFQENGKPVLSGIHFNISHSDHRVICAFSKEGLLGVDLEKVSPIDFENFTPMFSAKEWATIKSAAHPIRVFYWFWTRKESIIKALGLKLSYLHQIELDVSRNYIIIDGKQWMLQDLALGEAFLGALCCEEEIEVLEVVDVAF